MAKKNTLKKNLVNQILDKAGIAYDNLDFNGLDGRYPDDVDPSSIFKTLALIGDKTGPVIGILPITEHLALKKIAKASGNKKVVMIPQKDLEKTTGYVHGANNPIGIRQKHRFPNFIDENALEIGQIIVSAGELGRSIRVDSQALADFVQATFVDLKEEQ